MWCPKTAGSSPNDDARAPHRRSPALRSSSGSCGRDRARSEASRRTRSASTSAGRRLSGRQRSCRFWGIRLTGIGTGATDGGDVIPTGASGVVLGRVISFRLLQPGVPTALLRTAEAKPHPNAGKGSGSRTGRPLRAERNAASRTSATSRWWSMRLQGTGVRPSSKQRRRWAQRLGSGVACGNSLGSSDRPLGLASSKS